MTVSSQLVGSPCGQRGSYLFYKSFRLCKNGKSKSISVGDCFFVQTSSPVAAAASAASAAAAAAGAEVDVTSAASDASGDGGTLCIGELQLLWEDKNINRTLTSCRLYYLPENTPEGRLEHHGEDEVVAMSERVVLHVDDLVQWIASSDVRWERGLKGLYSSEEKQDDAQAAGDEAASSTTGQTPAAEVSDDINASSALTSNHSAEQPQQDPDELAVKILSYSQYCRYRAILKRLEHMPESWFYNALVIALGGFTVPTPNWRLLFCRETFDHPQLEANELHCGHLAPILKGRPKKRRLKSKRSNSPSSESNESEESRELQVKEEDPRNGLKSVLAGEDLEEQEFLQRLFKFMRERNTPIERVPHLGFKQINLYVFYTYAQKLGGYNKITLKKLWKHIYDELGGNPGSTSAATCTRRHYEKLLLPYERHASGRTTSAEDTRKMLVSSSSSPTTSPTLPSTPVNSSEPLSPGEAGATELTPNESYSSPIPPASGDRDLTGADSQQQNTSEYVQTPPGSFVPISLTPSVNTNFKQSNVTVVPVPLPVVQAPTVIHPSSSKADHFPSGRDVPANSTEELKNVVPVVSRQNNIHPAISLEVSGQAKSTFSLPKKRAKDEHIAEIGRKWEEVRRKYALEKERNRQISASNKSSSLRSIRFCGKDSVAKSSILTECQDQICSKPTFSSPLPSSGSDSCVPLVPIGVISSSLPLKDGSCSSGIDSPKMVSRIMPNSVYESYCDKKLTKMDIVEERRPEVGVAVINDSVPVLDFVSKGSPPVSTVENGGNCSLYKAKENNNFDRCLRPSVIQHTHSAAKIQLNNIYMNRDNSYESDVKQVTNHDLNRRPLETSPSIPAAHQNHASVSHFSIGRPADFVSEQQQQPLRQPPKNNFVMPFNQVKNVPGIAPQLSTNHTKNYGAPVVTRLPFPPVRKSSPSPWTSSSPNGRPPSRNAAEKRPESTKEADNIVLDLSCNKKLKPCFDDDCHTNRLTVNSSSSSEERELDLSIKSKRPATIKEVSHEQQQQQHRDEVTKPRVKIAPLQQIVRGRQYESSVSVPTNLELSGLHHGQHDFKPTNKPLPVLDKRLPSPRLSASTPSSVSTAMAPHNLCYMTAESKMPSFYPPEYNSQIPNILSPSHPSPHLYGLPFPVTTAHPHLIPEHLQANFASVYKEIYQKGVSYHPVPYPTSYDFASHLYPTIYKEQSSPYLYYPK